LPVLEAELKQAEANYARATEAFSEAEFLERRLENETMAHREMFDLVRKTKIAETLTEDAVVMIERAGPVAIHRPSWLPNWKP
jgi:hypothetical protein